MRSISWLVTEVVQLLVIALLLLLLAAWVAPFESLGWWAGWNPRTDAIPPPAAAACPACG